MGKGFLQVYTIKDLEMRLFWISGWALIPMTSITVKIERIREKMTTEAETGRGKDPPLQPPEGTWPF